MKIEVFLIFLALGLSRGQTLPPDICEGLNQVFVPHPTDCSLFVLCVLNLPEVFPCRLGEIFNPTISQCVPGELDFHSFELFLLQF